jgi:hypothetical protein
MVTGHHLCDGDEIAAEQRQKDRQGGENKDHIGLMRHFGIAGKSANKKGTSSLEKLRATRPVCCISGR